MRQVCKSAGDVCGSADAAAFDGTGPTFLSLFPQFSQGPDGPGDPSHGPARPTFCQVPRSAKFHVLTYPTASAQRLVGLGKSGAFSDQFPEEDAAGDGGVE